MAQPGQWISGADATNCSTSEATFKKAVKNGNGSPFRIRHPYITLIVGAYRRRHLVRTILNLYVLFEVPRLGALTRKHCNV